MSKTLLLVRSVVPGPAQHQVLALIYELLAQGVHALAERVVLFYPLAELVLV